MHISELSGAKATDTGLQRFGKKGTWSDGFILHHILNEDVIFMSAVMISMLVGH